MNVYNLFRLALAKHEILEHLPPVPFACLRPQALNAHYNFFELTPSRVLKFLGTWPRFYFIFYHYHSYMDYQFSPQ
jgi:hypothetical protein